MTGVSGTSLACCDGYFFLPSPLRSPPSDGKVFLPFFTFFSCPPPLLSTAFRTKHTSHRDSLRPFFLLLRSAVFSSEFYDPLRRSPLKGSFSSPFGISSDDRVPPSLYSDSLRPRRPLFSWRCIRFFTLPVPSLEMSLPDDVFLSLLLPQFRLLPFQFFSPAERLRREPFAPTDLSAHELLAVLLPRVWPSSLFSFLSCKVFHELPCLDSCFQLFSEAFHRYATLPPFSLNYFSSHPPRFLHSSSA